MFCFTMDTSRLPSHGQPVSMADFTLVKVIGQGSFGKVFMVRPNWEMLGQPREAYKMGPSDDIDGRSGCSLYRGFLYGQVGSSTSGSGGGGRVFAMKVVKKNDVKSRNQVSRR